MSEPKHYICEVCDLPVNVTKGNDALSMTFLGNDVPNYTIKVCEICGEKIVQFIQFLKDEPRG